MKRLLACVSLVAATTTAALPASPVAKPTAKPIPAHKKAPPIHVAPADEYFGKLKLSVLGIRNTIKDVGANLDIDQTRWTQLASKAEFAEDAMRDWQKKYPDDTWLAKMVFGLERMYAKLDNPDARQHSIACMKWLVHDFPGSWYGKTGRRELAEGKVGRPVVTAVSAPGTPHPDVVAAPSPQPPAGLGTASATGSLPADQPAMTNALPMPVPVPEISASPSAQPNP